MIPNRFRCMEQRDFSQGCRKCWTTPLTRDCLPRRLKDTTGPLSTLCTKNNVLNTPNFNSQSLQPSCGLFMTTISEFSFAAITSPWSTARYPRVLVSIVVSGTLSSRTLRCNEVPLIVTVPITRRLSLSWVFFNFTVSRVYPYPFPISCRPPFLLDTLMLLSRFS